MPKFRHKPTIVDAHYIPSDIGATTDHGFAENRKVFFISWRDIEDVEGIKREPYLISPDKFVLLYEPIDADGKREIEKALEDQGGE